jgi:hypothetical protein
MRLRPLGVTLAVMRVALEGSYRRTPRFEVRRELEPAATALRSVIDVTDLSEADPRLLAELLSLNQWRRRCGLPPLTLVATRPSEAVWTLFDICGMAMTCRLAGRDV